MRPVYSPPVLPVGDLWDQAGRYLLVTGSDNPGAAAAAGGPRGILQNAAFFHELRERPALGGGRLSLFSRYDGRTRVLGWVSPSRPMPPLKPPPADFGGRPLKFVSFEHEPTTLYLDGTPTGRLAGVDPYVARFAARLYNFTLLFSEPSDGLRWGDNGFGYWTGLVGDMVQRRAHFGMANLFITEPRSQIIDFSRPYDFEQACFVVWQPPPLPRWLALLRPFSISDWALVGAMLIVSVLTVLALSRAAAPRESPLFSQPGFVALYNIGGLVGVSHASLPRATSGQIFMGFWRFCALTLVIIYSDNLIANLTVPPSPAPLDTKQDLALSGVTVSGYGSMFGELLNASTNYWDCQLALKYEPTYDIHAALRRAYDHKGTYIVNSMSLAYLIRKYYTTASGEPLLRIMRQCFGSFMVGIALPRRSFLTPLLNVAVSRLTEAGLMQHWSRSALRAVGRQLAVGEESPDQPARDAEGRLSRLGLEALQGPFLLLMMGWAAALLSLVAEIAVKRCRRRVSRTG
ncbi:Glutamate receptor [Amphibalanus amphitrite]|uniref:Glutamate receptor n=1 Tax=Amphibalanus amphitrite TaxID=1232801 RepID=A0A6A4WB69_AMPAM|nr:Glutamate receptor [Amphibalanus amphitrite]